jgi:hypothetical protein
MSQWRYGCHLFILELFPCAVLTPYLYRLEENEADEDVPFFMRKFTNRYPFGNVHMALRIGPLIIENGVDQ